MQSVPVGQTYLPKTMQGIKCECTASLPETKLVPQGHTTPVISSIESGGVVSVYIAASEQRYFRAKMNVIQDFADETRFRFVADNLVKRKYFISMTFMTKNISMLINATRQNIFQYKLISDILWCDVCHRTCDFARLLTKSNIRQITKANNALKIDLCLYLLFVRSVNGVRPIATDIMRLERSARQADVGQIVHEAVPAPITAAVCKYIDWE